MAVLNLDFCLALVRDKLWLRPDGIVEGLGEADFRDFDFQCVRICVDLGRGGFLVHVA